jgi:hypothetical protein
MLALGVYPAVSLAAARENEMKPGGTLPRVLTR